MRGKNISNYKQSKPIPLVNGHFHRPRLDMILSGLVNRYLIIVIAGAGWGKTHGISTFLYKTQYRGIWFQLTELDNHAERFWENFIFVTGFRSKENRTILEQMGFPETIEKFDKFLHILASEIYTGEQIVYVFDDFHLIYDEGVINFTKKLINARLECFCIIINTRTKPSFSHMGMMSSETAGQITEEELRFTPEETEEYFKQFDISLTKSETRKLQRFTEGWPMALYLVRLTLKKAGLKLQNPLAGATPLLFEMIEKEMFNTCAPQVQSFLIKASLLNSFPEGLIKELAGRNYDSISKFMDNNTFIYYNPYTAYYSFHHIFLEYLKEKNRNWPEEEIRGTYLQAAVWCMANDLKLEALSYYEKTENYDEILNILLNFGSATFQKSTADYLLELIDKFPRELVKKNPMIHVLRAGLLLNNAEIKQATEELKETQKELEAVPDRERVLKVLGNIYFMLGLLSMGSGNYDFVEFFKKSCECLPEGGIVNNEGKALGTKYAIMLTSPRPGELKKMEEALLYGMPCASKAMHGYGSGYEYLASAEAAYLTGDMKKGLKQAYEAIYRARKNQVSDVVSGGYFLLMRIEAMNGNYEGVVKNLEELKTYVDKLEEKFNFNGMSDIAEGWFYLTMGKTEKVAGWIADEYSGDGVLAPYSIGMERMIHAKYMIMSGKYYELLAWLGQMEETLRQVNGWLMLMDVLIYKSIALHHIQEHEQAAVAFTEAYDIGHENNLTTQFIENGNEIRGVIYNIKEKKDQPQRIGQEWLDEIYTKAATYEKHQRRLRMQYRQEAGATEGQTVKLTKREKEVLGYLCQGLTNSEIAGACYITISAVKKMLNTIYVKLGATNRVDASRIAMQMGLN